LEVEIGNPEECAKDINITETDLANGLLLIEKGINEFSLVYIERGISMWAEALIAVNKALADCGAGRVAEDIAKILEELSSGLTGVLRFLALEILNIIDSDFRVFFQNAIDALNAGDYYKCGVNSGKIIAILLEPGATVTSQ